jgi:predicted transcriptional regulator
MPVVIPARPAEPGDQKTQLVVVLPLYEKELVVEAARKSCAPSLSAFIRDAVLERSRAILGSDALARRRSISRLPLVSADCLDAFIGGVPDDRSSAHAVFPRLHAFAAHLSDRNRAILRWIGTHEAESIHELSRRFDYSYAGLSRTLGSLAAFGIVGYDVGADARCQPPRLLCRRLRLHLAFRDDALAHPRILSVGLGEAPAKDVDITCASMDEFSTVVTDCGFALLRLIAAHDPPTIGAVGKLTGTTSQNAYPVLRRLEKFGLVRMEGGSRKRKPILLYDGLTFDIDLLS